jgi:DNA-directed RNA polymerase subunit M/transcription elongation factor TFIIS
MSSIFLSKSDTDTLSKISQTSGISIDILKRLLSVKNVDGQYIYYLDSPDDYMMAIYQIRDNPNLINEIESLASKSYSTDFMFDTSYFKKQRAKEYLEADIKLNRRRVREIKGVVCRNPNCKSFSIVGDNLQVRSADEPTTTFYRCQVCGTTWRSG